MFIALCSFLSLAILLLGEIKNRKTSTKDCSNSGKLKPKKSSSASQIIGKTKTKVGQTGTAEDKLTTNCQHVTKEYSFANDEEKNKRLIIPDDEMDKVFYTREEAELNVDVKFEYEELDWEEGDDGVLIDTTESNSNAMAQGVSFDEMNEVSQILQNDEKDLSNDNVRHVVKTINTVETTDMFKQLVCGVNGGEQKVADILDRCEALLNPATADKNIENEEFDINNYM
jgi:hypothetical protein